MTVPPLAACKPLQDEPLYAMSALAGLPSTLWANNASVVPQLHARGFRETQPGTFEAADGSWVQLDARHGSYLRGIGAHYHCAFTNDIDSVRREFFDVRKHGSYAVASLPSEAGSCDLALRRATLIAAGFAQVLPSYFSHPDGSWVGWREDKLYVGAPGFVLDGAPPPGQRGPVTTPQRDGGKHTSLPFPSDWGSWRKNFAVAQLPNANGGEYSGAKFTWLELVRVLRHLGFRRPFWALSWQHPDGSWCKTRGGRIRAVGFQRWAFGELPYQRNRHIGQWATDSAAWRAWLDDPKRYSPPFAAREG